MAPTVCLSELPIIRPTLPCSRRRHRVFNGVVTKQQRLELRRVEMNPSVREDSSLTPPESPLSSPNLSARVPANIEEHWKVLLARRKGLLDIVIRTIALVRRNNILQERVNALREETRDFINSVLSNPENKCRQHRLEMADSKDEDDVSSSTERIAPKSPSLPPTPDSTYSPLNDVTSTCGSTEHDTEQSSDDDES